MLRSHVEGEGTHLRPGPGTDDMNEEARRCSPESFGWSPIREMQVELIVSVSKRKDVCLLLGA